MRIWEKLTRVIPGYAIPPLIWCLVWNCTGYWGCRVIAGNWYHYDMTTSLDLLIPVLPWTTSIYFICYLFWGINYIMSARQGQEAAYRFLGADFMAKCICFVFFIFLPTTNIRPEITEGDFWSRVLLLLYGTDAADNLFPSIHCLVSWFCFIGIRGKKTIPVWYQVFSCVAAVMVFISTLTTRQHVLADVISAVVIAEGCYWITGHTVIGTRYSEVFRWLDKKRKEYMNT